MLRGMEPLYHGAVGLVRVGAAAAAAAPGGFDACAPAGGGGGACTPGPLCVCEGKEMLVVQ
jgi:hypothetical protein